MIVIFLILFFHDIGHILVLRKLGYKINRIEMLPFGGNIETNMGLNSSSKDILFVSIAGVIFQILLFFIMLIIYNTRLISGNFYNIFLKYNTILIIFNMLPIYPLDGSKVFSSVLEYIFNYKMSLTISIFISFISCLLFLYINYLFELDNYPIIIFLLFKLIAYIKEYKFVFNKFLLERILSNQQYKKIKNISSVKNIYKNKLNFINGVNERKFLLKKFNK